MSIASQTLRSVAGRSIFISGGASGLGEATARYLTELGAKVTIFDLKEKINEKIQQQQQIGKNKINNNNNNITEPLYVAGDVTSAEDVKQAIFLSKEVHGPLFSAINCAGICPGAKLLGKKGPHSLSLFQKVIEVNLIGTFNVCTQAAEAMANNKKMNNNNNNNNNNKEEDEETGVLINTASVAAFEGQIGQPAYSASKGGVVAMTLPLARELAGHGIRVNTICPGIMETPMMAGLPIAAQEALGKMVPFPPRLGKPNEFAATVHFILSNPYMNGECIRLDGAIRLQAK